MKFSEIKTFISSTEESKYNDYIESLQNDSRKNVQNLGQKLLGAIEKKNNEIIRVQKMYDFDKSYDYTGFIAGADEVGRGPLAGPIAAAAVILDLNCVTEKLILEINDSKKLSPKKREELSEKIKENAIAYNIYLLDNEQIDQKGIGFCNQEVLKQAVLGLKEKPSLVLSDGYAIKNLGIKNEFVIKGDSKSASIACASIIAKVYRDNLMKQYAEQYSQYHFDGNAGYGSKEHIEAIKKYGPCPIHRWSFLNNILNEN